MSHSYLIMCFAKKARLLAAVLPLLLFSSCGVGYLKLTGNLREPRLEDRKSVASYARSKGDPFDVLWLPKSKKDFDQILKKYTGVPEVLIYDQNYALLKNANGRDCHKMLINFFRDSTMYGYIKVKDSSFINLREKVITVDSNNIAKLHQYTIVYMWVKYVPKLTKKLFESLQEIKASNHYNICFVSLNKDWQKGMYTQAPKFSGSRKNKRKK